MRNGACGTERFLWQPLLMPYCCAKTWPMQQGRRLTRELKASKFLSFHVLAASLVFNRSQWSPKEVEVTGERGGRKRRESQEEN